MIRVLLFDFFDVLHVDCQKAWLAAKGYQREGGFAEASNLLDAGLIDFDDYLERFAKASGSNAGAVRAEMDQFARIDHELVTYIEDLQKRYVTGLISNAHASELRPILEEYQLERLFKEMFISSEVGMVKPDPALFEYAADRLGAQPVECVFIDDNERNVSGAIELGMAGIVYKDVEQLRAQLTALGI